MYADVTSAAADRMAADAAAQLLRPACMHRQTSNDGKESVKVKVEDAGRYTSMAILRACTDRLLSAVSNVCEAHVQVPTQFNSVTNTCLGFHSQTGKAESLKPEGHLP